MCVIGHAIDCNQLLAFSRNDSGDVFLQLFAMLGGNHTCATGDSEDNVQINLCVGIGHSRNFT